MARGWYLLVGGAFLLAAATRFAHAAFVAALSVEPTKVSLAPGGIQQFTATLAGAPAPVSWRVQEADGGTVAADGTYTAPLHAGTFHIEAVLAINAPVSEVAVAVVREPQLGDVARNPKDGAVMVYVPAGAFLMGSPDGVGFADQQPRRTVTLDGYWIYRDDVTVDQYRKFCEVTKRAMPKAPDYGWLGDNPMTMVTWDDAKAYADWAGVALPTEAQWEKAARGTDGRNYPWGGTATVEDPSDGWDTTKCACWATSQDNQGMGIGPHAVGSFPAGNSPYGAHDMAGNVWQWCADWYGPYDATAATNPTGPATGTVRVLRGGSWGDDKYSIQCAYRRMIYVLDDWTPDGWNNGVGFRCVALFPPPTQDSP
jgi:formylglycine-generating enzyme required for sulfatase activity